MVLYKASERVFVGNWADKRFVQNVSKIPPLRFRLLIYFLSYTERLQLANLQITTYQKSVHVVPVMNSLLHSDPDVLLHKRFLQLLLWLLRSLYNMESSL